MPPKASHFLLDLYFTSRPPDFQSNALSTNSNCLCITTLPDIAKHCLNHNSSYQVSEILLNQDLAKKKEKERFNPLTFEGILIFKKLKIL